MNINAGTYTPFARIQGYSESGYQGGFGSSASPSTNVRVSPSTDPSDETGRQTPPDEAGGNSRGRNEAAESRQTDSDQHPESSHARGQLTEAEVRLVEKLQQIDQEVRRHEMAHMAAGGALITSAASFTYQRGPDGRSYAVGGEVGIDTTPVPGDPEATARKMRQVKSAALAPGDPSAQDLKVAANAAAEIAKALSEITLLKAKEQARQAEAADMAADSRNAANTYSQVGRLPEEDTATFRLAI